MPRSAGTAQDTVPKAPKGSRRTGDMRKSHWVQVKYRGGAEAWWEITFQGQIYRCPGHLSVDDILRRVVTGSSYR